MKLKHVLAAQLLLTVSILFWRIVLVRYDIGAYDTLQASDFAGALAMVLLASVLFLLTLMKSEDMGLRMFFILICFIILYLSPFIANFPYYVHRDVYLHLPHSLQILSSGNIPKDRWDVVSFPASFIYYAVFMGLVDLKYPEITGAYTSILYAVVMVVVLYYLAIQMRTSQTPSRYIVFLLLPFISRFAPAPSFPHRYHLAFILSLILIGIFLKGRELNFKEVAIITFLILITIVFTHPYFSTYVVLALLFYGVEVLLATIKKGTTKKNTTLKSQVIVTFVSIALVHAIHALYLADPIMLREAYSWFTNLGRIRWFAEISMPINVVSQNEYVTNLAFAVRTLWRITLLSVFTFALSLHLPNLIRGRGSTDLSLAFMVSAILTSVPLIISFLWWERSLTFIGLSLIISIYEGIANAEQYRGGRESAITRLTKVFVLVLLSLAVLVAPLARWERSLLPDMWQGVEKKVFHEVLCSHVGTSINSIYIGAYTGVEYTYCTAYLNPRVPRAVPIFDVERITWIRSPTSIRGLYAVAAWDPDFTGLNPDEMYTLTSIIWSSSNTYVFSS